jgi:hypothetical protein
VIDLCGLKYVSSEKYGQDFMNLRYIYCVTLGEGRSGDSMNGVGTL